MPPKFRRTIEIQFGRSSARAYTEVVRLAQSHPSYNLMEIERKPRHSLILSNQDDFLLLHVLNQMTGGWWKNRQIRVDDQEVESLNTACYAKYLELGSPPGYCENFKDFGQNRNMFGCADFALQFLCLATDQHWERSCRISDLSHRPVLYRFDKDMFVGSGQFAILAHSACPMFDINEVRRRFDLLCSVLPQTGNPKHARPALNRILAGIMYVPSPQTAQAPVQQPRAQVQPQVQGCLSLLLWALAVTALLALLI